MAAPYRLFMTAALLTVGFSAFASPRQPDIPNTATLLFVINASGYGATRGDDAIASARQQIQEKLRSQFGATEQTSVLPQIQLQCSAIYSRWSNMSRSSSGCGVGTLFATVATLGLNDASCEKDANVKVEVYCQPRAFDELVIADLYNRCRAKPDQSCFAPDAIKALQSFKMTQYIDVRAPSADQQN